MVQDFPNYERALRIVSGVVLKDGASHFVDVGANVGDTIAAIKSAALVRVEGDAIEASDYFFKFLKKNKQVLEPVNLHHKFASTSYPISQIRGVFHQWEGNAEVVEVGTDLIADIRDQIPISKVIKPTTGLLKIDCEGQDLDILKAALDEGLAKVPTAFIEIQLRNSDSKNKLLELLLPSGPFSHLALFDPYGFLVYSGDSQEEISTFFDWQLGCHTLGLGWRIPYFDAALFPVDSIGDFEAVVAKAR